MLHVTILSKVHEDFVSSYLDDSSDVHLGDHLSGVEKHKQRVQRERDILQRRIMLKCLGGVHTHGDDTDDGTGSQKGVHPLQKEDPRCMEKNEKGCHDILLYYSLPSYLDVLPIFSNTNLQEKYRNTNDRAGYLLVC